MFPHPYIGTARDTANLVHKHFALTYNLSDLLSMKTGSEISFLSEKDHTILRALEDLKAQVRQNTLVLSVPDISVAEEFHFPMMSDEDLGRREQLLRDRGHERALVRLTFNLLPCN